MRTLLALLLAFALASTSGTAEAQQFDEATKQRLVLADQTAKNLLKAVVTRGEAIRGTSGTLAEIATSSDVIICASLLAVLRKDLEALGRAIDRGKFPGADRNRALQAYNATQTFANVLLKACDDSAKERDEKHTEIAAPEAEAAPGNPALATRAANRACDRRCADKWQVRVAANEAHTTKLQAYRAKAQIAERARIDYNLTINAMPRAKTNLDSKVANLERAKAGEARQRARIARLRSRNPDDPRSANELESRLNQQLSNARTNLDSAARTFANLVGKLEPQRQAYEAAIAEREAAGRAEADAKSAHATALQAYYDCVRMCPSTQSAAVDLSGVWQLEGTTGEGRFHQSGSTLVMEIVKIDPVVPTFDVGDVGFNAQISGRDVSGRLVLRATNPEHYQICSEDYVVRFSATLSPDGKELSGSYSAVTIDLDTCRPIPSGQASLKYVRLRD